MSKKRSEKKAMERIKAHSKKSKKSTTPLFPMGGGMFANIEAPEGFRPIPAMQAVMEFGQPLLERAADAGVEEFNAFLQVVTAIWNFANPKVTRKPSQEKIIDQIGDLLELDETEAIELFEQMVERREYLFPEAIQPAHPMTMFMRKEVEYQFTSFDERQLDLSDKPIPPNADDQPMLTDLRRLDQHLADGDAYDDWEALYLKMENACCNQYYAWLVAKGAPEKQCHEFPGCVEIFLNFVYRYNAKALAEVSDFEVEEFFLDHLLRKVIIRPDEYVSWFPALRLFYTFLADKGYIDDPRRVMELLTAIEPEFIEVLKKQF